MPFSKRRRFRRRGSSNKRRGVYWDGNFYAGVVDSDTLYWDWMVLPSLNEIQIRDSTNLGYLQPREDVTLERTIVDLTVQYKQSESIPHTFYIGLITFESDDPTTPASMTGVPTPREWSDEWIWHQAVPFPKDTVSGIGQSIVTLGSLIDPNKSQVRSKRKLGANVGILVVVDFSSLNQGSGDSASFNADFRFLFKKPL